MPMPRTPEARSLTADDVAAYHRDGFFIARGLYSAEVTSLWKQTMLVNLGLMDASADTSQIGFRQNGIHVWMADVLPPALQAAMTEAPIATILKQLLGEPLEFLSAKAVFKDGRIRFGSPWHQDWFYWFGAEKTSVWIAVDDASPENGCLKLIPGSHRMTFANQSHDEEAFRNRIRPEDVAGLRVVDGSVRAGDAVFFSDRTVHASYDNATGADRWSLISTYRRADVADDSKVWAGGLAI